MRGPWVYMYSYYFTKYAVFYVGVEGLYTWAERGTVRVNNTIQTAIKGIINIKVTCQHMLTACGC